MAGLYGAIAVGFAALFGGTPAQISGAAGLVVLAGLFASLSATPALYSLDIGGMLGVFGVRYWSIHSPSALPGNIGLYVGHRCNHHYSSNRPLTGP